MDTVDFKTRTFSDMFSWKLNCNPVMKRNQYKCPQRCIQDILHFSHLRRWFKIYSKHNLAKHFKHHRFVLIFPIYVKEIWLCLHVVILWLKEAFSSLIHVFVFSCSHSCWWLPVMQSKHAVICTKRYLIFKVDIGYAEFEWYNADMWVTRLLI